jgi:hypothetical protein
MANSASTWVLVFFAKNVDAVLLSNEKISPQSLELKTLPSFSRNNDQDSCREFVNQRCSNMTTSLSEQDRILYKHLLVALAPVYWVGAETNLTITSIRCDYTILKSFDCSKQSVRGKTNSSAIEFRTHF